MKKTNNYDLNLFFAFLILFLMAIGNIIATFQHSERLQFIDNKLNELINPRYDSLPLNITLIDDVTFVDYDSWYQAKSELYNFKNVVILKNTKMENISKSTFSCLANYRKEQETNPDYWSKFNYHHGKFLNQGELIEC